VKIHKTGIKLWLQGGYLEVVPGMAFLLCTINASIATFPTRLAAMLVIAARL
jgi:hypothetical protein